MKESQVYLNGSLMPLSEAKIPVLDRGFIFGDGIYEVIPVYGDHLFRAQEHMARLCRSLNAVGIPNPHDDAGWMSIVTQVAASCEAKDKMVYLQVTRGVAPRGHAFPKNCVPTVFVMCNPLASASDELRARGAHCVTIDDQRWLHCDIKSTSLLGNVLAAQYAAEHEATEAIQFRDGWLTEGSSSNIWVVKDGRLYAPPANHLILEGIRYALLVELAQQHGITFEARQLSRQDVLEADELLMSSATKEVLAVTRVDEHTIGNGAPGPIYEILYAAYQRAKLAPPAA